MTTVRELLTDQISNILDTKSWFPTMTEALEGLSFENALWKYNDQSHSIWDLVNHLSYWNEVYLRRFQHREYETVLDNDETFEQGEVERNEAAWEGTRKRTIQILDDWRTELRHCAEENLEKLISENPESGQWWESISNQMMHNSHHIGQIISIRKAQNSWENLY